MTSCPTLQTCVQYSYLILILCFLKWCDSIIRDAMDGMEAIQVKPDIGSTILWILMTSLPVFYYFNGDNSNIFRSSFTILLISILLIIYHNNLMESYASYIPALSAQMYSICIYKQFSLLQNVRQQYLWFDANYKTKTDDINIYIKWIMYALTNTLIYSYCCISDECDTVTINVCGLGIWLFLAPISFYLLPPANNIKYDLYHNRKQMIIFVFAVALNTTYCILWSFYLKYYINSMMHSLLLNLSVLIWFFGFTVFPSIFQKYKQHKFIKNNTECSWWNYILSNNSNFQNFYLYLSASKTVQNILFVFELMQYKNCIVRKLNMEHNGYLLLLNNNNQTVINPSPIINHIRQLAVNEIVFDHIKCDLGLLYNKYIIKDTDDGLDNLLYATFVSQQHKNDLYQSLKSATDLKEIINIFDKSLQETAAILQLLYIEYQLDR